MNRKMMSIAIFVILLVSALGLYLIAQSQTQAPRGMGQGSTIVFGSGPYVVGNGVKAPVTPVTLCTGPVMATDGSPKCLYNALPASGKLRIEMQDGTTQEIDLKNVKKMTIE